MLSINSFLNPPKVINLNTRMPEMKEGFHSRMNILRRVLKKQQENIANRDPPFSPFLSTLHRCILRILFNIMVCQGC